jgi:DNA-binding transcriptional ArsR family regulator
LIGCAGPALSAGARRRVAEDLRLLVRGMTFPLLERLSVRSLTSRELAVGLGVGEQMLSQELGGLVGRGLVREQHETAGTRYAARDSGLLEAASRLARLGPLAEYPRLLGDPTRLLLLELLGVSQSTVAQLADATARSHPCVSRHLSALYALRFVDRRFERNRFVYSLRDRAVLEVIDLVAAGTHREQPEELVLT